MAAELDSQLEDQLDEIVLAYLKAVDAGETPDPQKILNQHPELRTELESFFEDQERANQFSLPALEPAAGTHPGTATDHDGPLASTTAYQPESRERYTIIRFHAGGGIGDVYLAQDGDLGRQVALKELKPQFADIPMFRARFLEEARITGQLEHPGIVPVHEVTKRAGDQKHFYTMRFIKGRTLAHAIKAYHKKREAGQTGPLDLRELLNVFVGVCNAVGYAHSRGVIHRDLKPQNVALGDFGEALVLDWGLAKVLGEKSGEDSQPPVSVEPEAERGETLSGQRIGTIPYMAPEQAEGRIDLMDRRTDVYGLGAILYEILTGEPPFTGPEESVVLDRVQHEVVTSPCQRVPETSPALDAVCLKALTKKREDRYESAKGLAQEIERYLADEPVDAYPEPWLVRVRRWLGKHRTLATAAAAAIIVIGLAIGIILLEAANRKLQTANGQMEIANGQLLVSQEQTKEALKSSKTYHYFHRIGLAERDWESNNIARTRELLQDCDQEEQRRWEWRYLQRLCHTELLVLSGHTKVLRSVAITPDGRYLASSGTDKEIKLWNAVTGKELLSLPRLPTEEEDIWSVTYSPNGNLLASASGVSKKGIARVWKMDFGPGENGPVRCEQILERQDITGEDARLAFSPDGKYLAIASGIVVGRKGQVQVIDIATKKDHFILPSNQEAMYDVAFSPDGLRIATGSGASNVSAEHPPGNVQIWDAQSGKELKSLSGHAGAVYTVAYSPDGRWLSSAGVDKVIRLWSTSPYKEAGVFPGHTAPVRSLSFRPDKRQASKQLASAGEDAVVRVWDLDTREELNTLRGHTSDVMSVAYYPNGQRLVSAGDQTLRVWNATNVAKGLHSEAVQSVAFSPDGRWLASGS
ncbi:MAG: WD40 repeat domain-containing serine/threonine protein kinase, partial [Gemmataceae bacterium]